MKKFAWYTWLLLAVTVMVAFDGFGLDFFPLSYDDVACYDEDSGLMARAGYKIVVDGVSKRCQLDGTWAVSAPTWFHPDVSCREERDTYYCGVWGGKLYSSLSSFACYEEAYKTQVCNVSYLDCSKYSIHDDSWTQCYNRVESDCEDQESGLRYAEGVGYGVLFYSGGESVCYNNQEYLCTPGVGITTKPSWQTTGKSCGVEVECLVASDCVNDDVDWNGERQCVNNVCVFEAQTGQNNEPPVQDDKNKYLMVFGGLTLVSLFVPRRQI